MDNMQVPYGFSDKVMASIEKEIARREKREEILMYSAIAATGLGVAGILIFIAYKYNWFAGIAAWFHFEMPAIGINSIWIIVFICSILLISVFFYFTAKQEKEFISPA